MIRFLSLRKTVKEKNLSLFLIEKHYDTTQNEGHHQNAGVPTFNLTNKNYPIRLNNELVSDIHRPTSMVSPGSQKLSSLFLPHSRALTVYASSSFLQQMSPPFAQACAALFVLSCESYPCPQQVHFSHPSWVSFLAPSPHTTGAQVIVFTSLSHCSIFLTVLHAFILSDLKPIQPNLAMFIF